MRWILWRRITLGIYFLNLEEIKLSNVDGFIGPNIPLKVLLSVISLISLQKICLIKKELNTLRPFPY